MVDFRAQPYRAVIETVLGAVLDGFGLERASIVGASIGDLWAVRYALDHPERVARLVLLGGGPISEEIRGPHVHPPVAIPPLGQVDRSGCPNARACSASKPQAWATRRACGWHDRRLHRVARRAEPRRTGAGTSGRWSRPSSALHGFVDGLVPTAAEVGTLRAPVRMIVGSENTGSAMSTSGGGSSVDCRMPRSTSSTAAATSRVAGLSSRGRGAIGAAVARSQADWPGSAPYRFQGDMREQALDVLVR